MVEAHTPTVRQMRSGIMPESFQNARVYWEMYGGVPPEGNDQHVQALNLNMDVGGWAADDYAYFQVSVYGRKDINSPNLSTLYSAPIHRPTGSIMWKPVRIAVANADTDVRCVVVKVELIEATFIEPDGSANVLTYSDQYQDADAPPWGIRIHEASLYCSDLVRDVRAHRVFADILAGRGFTYSGPVATWTADQLEFSDIPKDRWDALDDVNGMLGWNYACWDGTDVEFALPKSGTAHVIAASDPRTTWSVEESLDETYNAVRVCYGNKSGKPREVIVHGSTAALRGTVRADTLQAPESIKSEKAARRFARRYLASHETKQVAGSVSIQGKAPDVPGFSATGGTVTTDGLYTVHTFTEDGALECTGLIDGTVDGPGGGTCGAYGTGAAALAGSMAVVKAYTDNIIPVMTSATAPSGAASASSEFTVGAGLPAWKAFNHANADLWGGWMVEAGTTGHVQYQFPAAHIITQYAVTSRNEGIYSCPPKTWTFEGSTDGATWTTLDTQTNITDWAATANVRKVFDFTNATAYAYYRLDITASNDAGYVGVGEMEMMEGGVIVVRYLTTPDIVGLDPLLIRPGDTVKMTGPARSLSGTHEITRVTLRPLEWTADVEFGTNSKRFDTWLARLAAGAKSIKRR